MTLTHHFPMLDVPADLAGGGVVDALYRFGLGQDLRHQAQAGELFRSAFTGEATLDFRPAAQFCGLDVPLMQGRDTISSVILNPETRIVTTHVVSNPRVQLTGPSARLTAMVEAQHLPVDDRSRHALLKNYYDVHAEFDGKLWRMSSVVIDCVWFTGDPRVIVGN